jgi:subtilisin family serine protease
VTLAASGGAAQDSRASNARVTPWLETAIRQERTGHRHLVWIYLRDKGTTADTLGTAPGITSNRARMRRGVRGTATAKTSIQDIPVQRSYVERIRAGVVRVRHESRWMNAVSAEATASQIDALATLPFIDRIDVLRRYRRGAGERLDPYDGINPIDARSRARPGALAPRDDLLDYGSSLDQVAQIGVPELHARGLSGRDVVVAVFDSGFPMLSHDVFRTTTIVAERDFVNGLDSVRDSVDAHGTATLSVLGGFREGELIGPAYGASFLLAITEDARSETPIEEDNWVAAAEWAEAMGADVISSSLGYLEFDLPHTSYTDRDMDGETAITTRAAAMAAERGVIVVNSAGNAGWDPDRNTLGAPADGLRVLATGAVDLLGERAPFSSVGPTADGRIKPDLAALGVRAKVAHPRSPSSYARASGTSFSCPLTAGVVALLLQAHPTYTVDQVLHALRSTASQSEAPDNLLGWGLIDAVRAVDAGMEGAGPVATRRERSVFARRQR